MICHEFLQRAPILLNGKSLKLKFLDKHDVDLLSKQEASEQCCGPGLSGLLLAGEGGCVDATF